jgi:hypothetical protein
MNMLLRIFATRFLYRFFHVIFHISHAIQKSPEKECAVQIAFCEQLYKTPQDSVELSRFIAVAKQLLNEPGDNLKIGTKFELFFRK